MYRPRLVAALVAAVCVLPGCQFAARTVDASPTSPTSTAAGPASPAVTTGGAPTTAEPTATGTTTTSAAAPIAPSVPGTATTVVETTAAPPLAGLVIVVDPGHNGANGAHPMEIDRPVDAGGLTKPCNTTGTASARLTESAFNWSLAQRVRQRLEAAGATVVLTRQSDDGWGPCVDQRGRTAALTRADLLVSLHADGAASSRHGFHVIHPGLVPGYTEEVVAPSREFATALRDALAARGLSTSTYLGRDGLDERTDLGTLNWARVPCVMLEAGNLRNPADAAFLASDDGQDTIADAVVAAVQTQYPG